MRPLNPVQFAPAPRIFTSILFTRVHSDGLAGWAAAGWGGAAGPALAVRSGSSTKTALPSIVTANVSTGGRLLDATHRPSTRLYLKRCHGQMISRRATLTLPSERGPFQCGQIPSTA